MEGTVKGTSPLSANGGRNARDKGLATRQPEQGRGCDVEGSLADHEVKRYFGT